MSRIPVNSRFRDLIKYRAGALCLIGILMATYMHTSAFMAQFFYGSLILGSIAAFAIDAGVVAMALYKDELLKKGDIALMVRWVTICVLAASGIANMSEGFKSAYGVRLTMDSLFALDILTWIQWLAGTVIFPIMAYIMTDTIGTRNLQSLYDSMRQGGGSSPALSVGSRALNNGETMATGRLKANEKIKKNRDQRIRMLEDFLSEYPDASLNEMADAVGVSSRETIRKYLQEIEGATTVGANASRFSRNGV